MAEYELAVTQLINPKKIPSPLAYRPITYGEWDEIKRANWPEMPDINEPYQVWFDLHRGQDLIDGAVAVTAVNAVAILVGLGHADIAAKIELLDFDNMIQGVVEPGSGARADEAMLTTEDIFAARFYRHIQNTAHTAGQQNSAAWIDKRVRAQGGEVGGAYYARGKELIGIVQLVESAQYKKGSAEADAQKAIIEAVTDSPIVEVTYGRGEVTYCGLIRLEAKAAAKCLACSGAPADALDLFCPKCKEEGKVDLFSYKIA